VSQEHFNYAAMLMNPRPRQTLGCHTPAEVMNKKIAYSDHVLCLLLETAFDTSHIARLVGLYLQPYKWFSDCPRCRAVATVHKQCSTTTLPMER